MRGQIFVEHESTEKLSQGLQLKPKYFNHPPHQTFLKANPNHAGFENKVNIYWCTKGQTYR